MWQHQVTCNKSHIIGSRFLHAIGVKEEINELGLEQKIKIKENNDR